MTSERQRFFLVLLRWRIFYSFFFMCFLPVNPAKCAEFVSSPLDDLADYSFVGSWTDGCLGCQTPAFGDLNGDGYLDLVAGASTCDDNGIDSGKAIVLFGDPSGWSGDVSLWTSAASYVGDQAGDLAGSQVLSLSDIDHDGYDELLITAPGQSTCGIDCGAFFVIYGKNLGWNNNTLLSFADIEVSGAYAGGRLGFSVDEVGDIDGSSAVDIAIGAPNGETGEADLGTVYLIDAVNLVENPHVDLGLLSTTIQSVDAGLNFGGAIASLGDVDGDGVSDFIIGHSNEDNDTHGRAAIYFGRINTWPASMYSSDSDSSYYATEPGDGTGRAVASAGDVDGDGYNDILIGAPFDSLADANAGRVDLIYGKQSGWANNLPVTLVDVRFYGESGGDFLGYSVSGGGDINNDGRDDFLFGAPEASYNGGTSGRAYLLLGASTYWGQYVVDDVASAYFDGEYTGDHSSQSILSGIDVDQDGFSDLVVGASENDHGGTNTGRIYVASGSICIDADSDGDSACSDCDDSDPYLNLADFDLDTYSSCGGDCDDASEFVYPGANELCDGIDGDCDGAVPVDELDLDLDGFLGCEECDDQSLESYPGAVELCDGLDNDCDGGLPVWDLDNDGDGVSVCAGDCDDGDPSMNLEDPDGDGFSPCDGDCLEGDGGVFPGAVEDCDGIDGDCDGELPAEEVDGDGDGVMPCAGDCDDQHPGVHPGADEECDGMDNDCNGLVDDRDLDGDGFVDTACGGGDCDDSDGGVHPESTENCTDGLDNDCNGLLDEEDPACTGDDDSDDDDDASADDDDDDDRPAGGCQCTNATGSDGNTSASLLALLFVCGFALRRVAACAQQGTGRGAHGCDPRRIVASTIVGLILSAVLLALASGCETEPCDDDTSSSDDDDFEPQPGGQIESEVEVDLGAVYLGESAQATLEIRNTGEQPLVITDIFVSGTESTMFSVVFENDLELVADSDIYYPLQISYAPDTALRSKTTLVIISSAFNAAPGEPYQVILIGQGVQDLDGDGFPWGEGYEGAGADCDDANEEVHPEAFEECDGLDNDCDGGIDDVPDGDGDGVSVCGMYPDCDDSDPYIHPMWVDPDATGGNGTEEMPYGSIDDSLNEQNCGFVLLKAGRYFEGHRLEVTAAPLEIVSVDGPLAAEVHGSGDHGLFAVRAGPVGFRGLLFQDGHESAEAGAVEASADVGFDLCAFRYNSSDADAGAISVTGGGLQVENSNFFMNRGSSGGGVFFDGTATGSDATIRSCSFVANSADYGAGAFLAGGDQVLESNQFLLNDARFGGGVWLEDASSASLTSCQFHGNSTPAEDDSGGAGLVVVDSMNLWVDDCLFSGNSSQLGGGALVYRSTGVVEGSSFQSNWVNHLGGALYLEGAYVEVDDCSFAGNEAVSAGGAVHARDDNIVSFHRSLLLGNRAGQGGGIGVDSGSLSLSNCLLDANEGDGAAIHFDGAALSMESVTMFDNVGPEGSAAVVVVSDPAGVDLRHSILADSVPAAVACAGEGMAWDYNNFHNSDGSPAMSDDCLPTGTGMLDSAPWFIEASADLDPHNDTLQLQAISPCIDAGDPTCLDIDGTTCDLGAYGGSDPL